jgi:hypothetical protein
MTQFQNDLIVTLLDILSFASVTTDLYGRRIKSIEQVLHDPKRSTILSNLIASLKASELVGIGLPGASLIVMLYRIYPLRNVLLWQGALLFLLARSISLYYSYTHSA